MKAMQAYAELCFMAGRETDVMEYMAWSMLKIEPDWYKELTHESISQA